MPTSKPSDDVLPLSERGHAFLHRARGLKGLAPHQLSRIARRLEAPAARRQRRGLVRALAVAALVLTAGTALAWASGALEHVPGWGALFRRAPGARPAATALAPALQPVVASPAPARPAADENDRENEGAEQGPPVAPDNEAKVGPERALHREQRLVHRPSARRHGTAAPSPLSPAPNELGESAIVLEGRSFARALELWRAKRDAPAALAALDEHDRRFADGQMRAEALVLRAEILLAGRREREALAALDHVSLDQVPRGRELHTLRGELRVRFGRCADGRADLAPVAQGADAHAARARQALARCP